MSVIIIVEDDVYLRDELIHTFQMAGYEASGPSSFENVERELTALHPDLVILDVNLPGKSGYELCKSLKMKSSSFPILILTACDTLSDELTALGLGADDFLTKPCHPDRLLARVGRLLQTYDKFRSLLQIGTLSLDTDTYKLTCAEKVLILSETEGKIMRLLMEQHPNIVPKGELFRSVWGTEEFVDENILQVNMSRLRKNLADAGIDGIIRNIRGKGYVLEVNCS